MIQDSKLEAVVISSLVAFSDMFQRSTVGRECFFAPKSKQLWDVLTSMQKDGTGIDPVTVHSVCRERYGDDRARDLIAFAVDPVVSRRHLSFYEDRLKRIALKRRLIAIEDSLQKKLAAPGLDPDQIDQERASQVKDARETYWPTAADTDPLAAEEELRAYYQRYEELRFTLGWPSLDNAIGRIYPSSVLTILARPGIGKSALGLNIAANWLRQDQSWGVMFCSLEMGKTLATDRIIRVMQDWGGMEIRHAMTSGGTPDEYRRMCEARYAIFADSRQSLENISEAADRWERRTGRKLRAFVLDYFQYLSGQGNETSYQKASRLSRELKEFAKDRDALVVNLCQVGRGEAGGRGKECPSLEAARDSGTIEENADIVLGMWRKEPESNSIHFQVLKNRQGPAFGSAVLEFKPDTMTMLDETNDDVDDDVPF